MDLRITINCKSQSAGKLIDSIINALNLNTKSYSLESTIKLMENKQNE
jgi:hypothetical protein